MDIDLSKINSLAVLIAVILNMALGALWYSSILFARPWMKEVKMTVEDVRHNRSAAVRGYIISVIGSIVIAIVLAVLVQATGATSLGDGLVLGLLAGLGFVATANASSYSFEGRSLRLYLINTGYSVTSSAIIGILLALWQ